MNENHVFSGDALEEIIELVCSYGNEIVQHANPLCRGEEMLSLTDERTTLIQAYKKLSAIICVAKEGLESVDDLVRHRSTIDMDAFEKAVSAEGRVYAKHEAAGRDLRREMELESAQRHDYNVEVHLRVEEIMGGRLSQDFVKIADALDSTVEEAATTCGYTTVKEHDVLRTQSEDRVVVFMVLHTPVIDIEERVDQIIDHCLATLDNSLRHRIERGSMAIRR